MEREGDYSLQEKKAGVQTESPEGEITDRDDSAEKNNVIIGEGDAKTLLEGRKFSKKSGFAGYVRFLWPYFLIIIFVFFSSFLTGYISAANFPDIANTLMEGFSSRFGPLLEKAPLEIMLAIFLNNAFVSLVSLVFGLALGILPILFVAFNGYLVGVISYIVAQQKGMLFISLALLPHGVVELPMVFLSASIGFRLGHQVFSFLLGRPTEIKREFKEGISFYFHWIVPLLLIAAIIETFVTPLIMSLVSGA
jgi:stage II sporulation protein M